MKKKIPFTAGIIFIIGTVLLVSSIVWQYSLFLGIDFGQFTAGINPANECNDHKDNDGDGYCDFNWRKAYCVDGSVLRDAGCDSKTDIDETNCGDKVCEGGETFSNCPTDCTCVPTPEVCDKLDNDCNGLVDDDLIKQCGITDVGPCQYGVSTCSAGVWGSCVGSIDPTTEVCDGIDNNCDGLIDEGSVCTKGSTAVTFQQLREDITLLHDMAPLPIIPTTWGWSYHGWPYQIECGPRNILEDGRDRYNPWGQIFPDPSTPENLNAGFELGAITFYVKLRSTGRWYTYEHGEVTGGYIFYGESRLPEVPNTSWSPIRGPGGGLFYKLGMGNWAQDTGAHWWPEHSHERLNNPDIEHLAVSITGRIVLQNSSGVDDRDKAKYLIGIGMDRRAADGSGIKGMLMSRHRYLTNEWQTFTMHSICPDMVEIELPPIHGKTW